MQEERIALKVAGVDDGSDILLVTHDKQGGYLDEDVGYAYKGFAGDELLVCESLDGLFRRCEPEGYCLERLRGQFQLLPAEAVTRVELDFLEHRYVCSDCDIAEPELAFQPGVVDLLFINTYFRALNRLSVVVQVASFDECDLLGQIQLVDEIGIRAMQVHRVSVEL